ncbi:MAG: L-serine ammonia-lyase, iron-sulfur-dependent, subunit alpha [Odoribacteraceae bacterium]|jgi:L-serine dehydratase|nr:L-serine ammonia-lyase, iron-sulfur-dependent, subunit alpha [Odoribacteraceae bacterium]
MHSIKEIFKIGYGPSSSHTMGPGRAARLFMDNHPGTKKIRVTLYGSLALTGKGHGTDEAIRKVIRDDAATEIIWKPGESLPRHPNGMLFEAIDGERVAGNWEVYSVGGGDLWDERGTFEEKETYPDVGMSGILEWCKKQGRSFPEYVEMHEGPDLYDYLARVWSVMQDAIRAGLENEGALPGPLRLARKAASYHARARQAAGASRHMGTVFAAALAVAEENAGGGLVVTAPTCGAAGVLPAVLYFLHQEQELSDRRLLKGLATAGLIGNIVKTRGSISGAEVGCQGELGTACAMAAGAAAQILGGSPMQVEYAAEMGFEHNLGLTCDPVGGYVQIPCIERNAFISQKARECAVYALFSDGQHKVSFDDVVETMMQTGYDMQAKYRETGLGGLASTCHLLTRKRWTKSK